VSDDPLYVAVDLGAGSGRVFLAGLAPGELRLEEVRRFRYPPRRVDGHLRWDAAQMFDEIDAGLRGAGRRARELGRPAQSVGVDGWGVDYGLIGADGHLIEDPVCYRDERTATVAEEVWARVPAAELFARTGIQFLPFNTVFQLYAHAREGLPARARRLLLVPDLVNLRLSGRAVTEFTNATTTQLLRVDRSEWDLTLMERLDLPTGLLPDVVPTGSDLGPLEPRAAAELGLEDARVVAPATHDTGSAVAGVPLPGGWAYVSSGTWSLVGVEQATPLLGADVARLNFTNEGGAFGTTRLLKNVMGLWILEQCRKEWEEAGLGAPYDRLLAEVERLDGCPGVIFPDDPRLLNPPHMASAIAEQLQESGQPCPTGPVALTRVILDSLAMRYASVLRTIESLTGRRIEGVRIVGGGSQNDYLNQATADASGLTVAAGPVEATVIGNVLVQAVSAGRFASLAEARGHVAEKLEARTFRPRPSAAGSAAAQRYAELEDRYVGARAS
jgi:rhamnulokinase